MKKIAFSAMLFLLAGLFTPAKAQVRFGVVGGMNITKLSFDEDNLFDSNNRAGWFVGPKVWFKVPLVGLGINAALEYSQRRMNGEVESTDGNVKQTDTYKSIEIPINVRYSFGLAKIASIFAETGPQFGFTVGDKTPSDIVKFKSSNVTWNVGAGVRLISHLEIGVNYNIALSNFGKVYSSVAEAAGISTKSDFKSNSWQVSAAYLF